MDTSSVSPGDAAVTMRSLPRRYGSALAGAADEDTHELATRTGPDGASALDHLAAAARGTTLLHQALKQVLQQDDPVLVPAVTDPGARAWEHPTDLEGELALLAEEAPAMADTIDGAHGKDWARTATVAGGGGEVSALDVAREAVRTGIDHLKAAEAAMAEARR